jgi:hypothetical protein
VAITLTTEVDELRAPCAAAQAAASDRGDVEISLTMEIPFRNTERSERRRLSFSAQP